MSGVTQDAGVLPRQHGGRPGGGLFNGSRQDRYAQWWLVFFIKWKDVHLTSLGTCY